MNFLTAVKSLYENTDEKIIVTDENLSVLWKNDYSLPDFLLTDNLNKVKAIPDKQSVILRYTDAYTIKARPIYESEELKGYILAFFDPEEIETLYDRSVHLKYKKNTAGNQKLALMPVVNTLDNCYTQGKAVPPDFFEQTKLQVLKLLSSSVNYQELSKYYSDEIYTELLNVSQCLEETAELFCLRFSDNCDFEADVEPGIFLNMNYDCMQNAVLNLLINGYMYNNQPKKALSLKTYTDDNKIIIEVWDNGSSADVEILQGATIPFKGIEKYGQRESLGLALVSKFANYFDGELTFEKQENGLTIKLSLDYSVKEKPQSFKLRRQPMVVGEFEPTSCILAKGLW